MSNTLPPPGDSDGPDDSFSEVKEEAAWREIIANFGERASLSGRDLGTPQVGPAPVSREQLEAEDEAQEALERWDGDGFVPPEPPPLPKTTPVRRLAWLGALGAPAAGLALFLLTSITGWWIPSWVTWLLIAAFLGGFGYLVATMSREPRDPYDDGSRL